MTNSAPTPAPAPANLGENKGIKFKITTGGKTWQCTLQDRAQYERIKSTEATKVAETTTEAGASTTASSSASTLSS